MNLSSPVTNPLLTQGQSSSVDARSLAALRTTSERDPRAAIKETAKQFEAMFMQQLLKSMREAQSAMSSGMMEKTTPFASLVLSSVLMWMAFTAVAATSPALAHLLAVYPRRETCAHG